MHGQVQVKGTEKWYAIVTLRHEAHSGVPVGALKPAQSGSENYEGGWSTVRQLFVKAWLP